jgi:hypothetical protein
MFATFNGSSAASDVYETLEMAEAKAEGQNIRAESMGLKARYEARPVDALPANQKKVRSTI